jgi:hypothetical protein
MTSSKVEDPPKEELKSEPNGPVHVDEITPEVTSPPAKE